MMADFVHWRYELTADLQPFRAMSRDLGLWQVRAESDEFALFGFHHQPAR